MKKIYTATLFYPFLILNVCFYVIVSLNTDPATRLTVLLSGVWACGYLLTIRRFISTPVNKSATKNIMYKLPKSQWINFGNIFIKNNVRFVFFHSVHILMALLPIFLFKNFPNTPLLIMAIFISNALLPIIYLHIIKRLHSLIFKVISSILK
jgi:hypothetical protein